jgi:hypothetical protein
MLINADETLKQTLGFIPLLTVHHPMLSSRTLALPNNGMLKMNLFEGD